MDNTDKRRRTILTITTTRKDTTTIDASSGSVVEGLNQVIASVARSGGGRRS
jgi:hypothetical protein